MFCFPALGLFSFTLIPGKSSVGRWGHAGRKWQSQLTAPRRPCAVKAPVKACVASARGKKPDMKMKIKEEEPWVRKQGWAVGELPASLGASPSYGTSNAAPQRPRLAIAHERWALPTRPEPKQIPTSHVPFFRFPPLFFHRFIYPVRTFHPVRGAGRLFPQLMKGSCLPPWLPLKPRPPQQTQEFAGDLRLFGQVASREGLGGRAPAPPRQRALPQWGRAPPTCPHVSAGSLME